MAKLILYNSRTHKKEPFTALSPERVNMYVCGPTVYDSAHLGHARAAVVFDLLYRILTRMQGLTVRYIRNFTDIDDKIIIRAHENGEDPLALAQRYIDEYSADMTALGTLSPDFQPRVTENIDGIHRYIQVLIDKGHAYASGGNVYFAVYSFPEYGKLSGRDTESMLSGQRLEEDFNKRDQLDFALWKAVKPGEPFWESPWGPGRPGWHIECSVMSGEIGAPTLDIHGGGRDLLFPHHENEVAQSECVHGQPFARFWIHNGFVNIGNEKMSKSSRNFVTVGEILKLWPQEVVRFFLLSSHYRSVLEFSWAALGEAVKQVERFFNIRRTIESLAVSAQGDEADAELDRLADDTTELVRAALADDLNTPRLIASLHDYSRNLNHWLDDNRKEKTRRRLGASWRKHSQMWQTVASWSGLTQQPVADFFAEFTSKGAATLGIKPEDVDTILQHRLTARADKNWAQADALRLELQAVGVVVEDTVDGTSWRIDADLLATRAASQS